MQINPMYLPDNVKPIYEAIVYILNDSNTAMSVLFAVCDSVHSIKGSYLPSGAKLRQDMLRTVRDESIRLEYCGSNLQELQLKYNLSARQIRRIIESPTTLDDHYEI